MERDLIFREVESMRFTPQSAQDAFELEFEFDSPQNHAEQAGYYSQTNNADVLYAHGHKARARTCNITTISMVLTAFGVKTNQTKATIDTRVLAKLYDHFKSKFTQRSLYELRFPDFLQLLAIYLKLEFKQLVDFDKNNIEAARRNAAASITNWAFMDAIAESFDNILLESKSVFSGQINTGLKSLGEQTRVLNKQTPKQTLSDGIADRVISLNAYRQQVLATIGKEQSLGYQIIIHEFGHFTVLLSMDASGIRHHDPGKIQGGNMRKTWDEARKKGMFSGYMRMSRGQGNAAMALANLIIASGANAAPISTNAPIQVAVAYNNANYSKWQSSEYAIYKQLGFNNMTPDPTVFAERLMQWQSQNGLAADGKLGPRSIQKLLATTVSTPSISVPQSSNASNIPQITGELLYRLGNNHGDKTYFGQIAAAINQYAPLFGMNTVLRMAHFVGQLSHETGNFRIKTENLNYSAERMTEVWHRRFPTVESARPYEHNPEKLGNFVYGGRLGNTQPSDGYRYRGRGAIQITGKENYIHFTAWCRRNLPNHTIDFVAQPDLVGELPYLILSAYWYYGVRKLNDWADKDDISEISYRINGSRRTVPERKVKVEFAKKLLQGLN